MKWNKKEISKNQFLDWGLREQISKHFRSFQHCIYYPPKPHRKLPQFHMVSDTNLPSFCVFYIFPQYFFVRQFRFTSNPSNFPYSNQPKSLCKKNDSDFSRYAQLPTELAIGNIYEIKNIFLWFSINILQNTNLWKISDK